MHYAVRNLKAALAPVSPLVYLLSIRPFTPSSSVYFSPFSSLSVYLRSIDTAGALCGAEPESGARACQEARLAPETGCCLAAEPHTPHPTPYTMYPTHPTPYTLHPTPYTLHSTHYALHPTPYTPYTLHPTPYTLHPEQ